MPKGLEKDPTQHIPKGKTLIKTLAYAFKVNKLKFILVIIFLTINGLANIATPIFLNLFVDNIIEPGVKQGWSPHFANLITIYTSILGGVLLFGCICGWLYQYLLVHITQDLLHQLRQDMFNNMERLPISFFDQNHHGDIMSFYTNDADTLRQLVSQCLPQVLNSIVNSLGVIILMLLYSLWLTLVIFILSGLMIIASKYCSVISAKSFMTQQEVIAEVEGFVEEMMTGQKVIKVFNHEKQAEEDFDKHNTKWYSYNLKGTLFGNILMPIIQNIGWLQVIAVGVIGSTLFITVKDFNVVIYGIVPLKIATIIMFISLSRQFTNAIAQISSQVSMILMGMAGASRVFDFLSKEHEVDDGNVTLVNCKVLEDGTIVETEERTGQWAWKQPANDKYPLTYRLLKGDIRLTNVDFGYVPEKIVLHDVSLYAKPGQKIAFVGATGAGKTTITNLINRFYDIADGKIRYDDININTIKKDDLRRSLGIILQDTNLFTGTIMDNIRYGRLDATDAECIAAAKLANAHDFIEMLPQGYQTVISGDGGSLSQGQKQLISIARAACCNPPVMIMDEATSSIDTRTEALVQKGTDKLMEGRTVFVIAHRLSTVQNSKAIMVLDHGRIIERGSHNDLIALHGTYYQLYTGAFELE